MNDPELRVVEAWHEALNDGEVDRLVGLSHPEVEVGGPRGIGRGRRYSAIGWNTRTFAWNPGASSITRTRWS